jgi:hypothetical protein
MLAEKVDDHAGFQQAHDLIWTPTGYARKECLAGAKGFRPVAARPSSDAPAGANPDPSRPAPPALSRPRDISEDGFKPFPRGWVPLNAPDRNESLQDEGS